MGFQVKIGLFKSSPARKDFKYFSNLRKLEGENISDYNLKTHTQSTLKNSGKILKYVSRIWIVALLDLEIEDADTHNYR